MAGELLLLHNVGRCALKKAPKLGGSIMGRKCQRYGSKYSPATGGMVRRCISFSGAGGGIGDLGGVPALGAGGTLKGTFDDVKDVAITAAIGAGGAIITDMVFDLLSKNIEMVAGLSGYQRALAEAATGIGIGIIVGKFLKKPRLGAKLAMGPVVLAALRIAGELLNAGPFTADRQLADIGMMSIDPYRPELAVGGADLASTQIGPGTPDWMLAPDGALAGAGVSAASVA